LKKLQQIDCSDYYSVFDRNGNKVCDSATLQDAMMMVSFVEGRTLKKVKILLDQVVNIPSMRMEDDKQLKEQKILNEGQGKPFTP